MIEHSKLVSVHNAIANFIAEGNFSRPFLIYSSTLDREEGIDYVIDTIMGNRLTRCSLSTPLNSLNKKIEESQILDDGYVVNKLYQPTSSLSKSDLESFNNGLRAGLPTFVIVSSAVKNIPEDYFDFEVHKY